MAYASTQNNKPDTPPPPTHYPVEETTGYMLTLPHLIIFIAKEPALQCPTARCAN